MNGNLSPIPRIESQAPNKNTIEWQIPGKVIVSFMLVARAGYFVFMKIKIEKKYWWSRSWKVFTSKSQDPAEALMNALVILEKYGYYIDANTIQVVERVGEPEYFKKLGL